MSASGISITRECVHASGTESESGTEKGKGILEKRNPINAMESVTPIQLCLHLYRASLTTGRRMWATLMLR